VLTLAGTALLAAAPLVHDPRLTSSFRHPTASDLLFRAGCLALVIGTVMIVVRDRRRSAAVRIAAGWRSRAETAELALARLAREELRLLADALRVYSDGRVSLFRAHEDGHFDLIARYSPNPTFDHGPGRGHYPMNEGALGLAWERQRFFGRSLPSTGAVAGQAAPKWVEDQQRRFGVPVEVSEGMTMRARTYAAVRLDQVGAGRCLGVLVFEDVRPLPSGGSEAGTSRLTEAVITSLVDETVAARIVLLLEQAIEIKCDVWARYRQVLALGPGRGAARQ
jgi:8-oxo-dGTP pyrophosphatase MutT (NUDIX family)